MNKLTTHEIIDETVEFYKTHPRSIDPNKTSTADVNNCCYIGPNGERCAFSRCCTPESIFVEGKSAYIFLSKTSIHRIEGVELFPQYQGHDPYFWNDLQALHDDGSYWEKTETGNILSTKGELKVLKLKKDWYELF